FFAVNQDGHAGRYAGQVKLLEIADFDGTVRKVIVGRRLKEECSSPAWGFDPGGACCPPILRWIRDAKHHVFGAAVWDVKEDHGGIDESVLRVKLCSERPDLIPIGRVENRDGTSFLDFLSFLFQFFVCFFLFLRVTYINQYTRSSIVTVYSMMTSILVENTSKTR